MPKSLISVALLAILMGCASPGAQFKGEIESLYKERVANAVDVYDWGSYHYRLRLRGDRGGRVELYLNEEAWRSLSEGDRCSWDGRKLRCRSR